MRKIVSEPKYENSTDYVNEITRMLDGLVVDGHKESMDKIGFCTYMMFRRHDGAAIRFPGATRGHVNFDTNNVITNVAIYTDIKSIYADNALDELQKYIGTKLIIPRGVRLDAKDN
jgi:hypothetical protein